jgi:hypothetical protein
MGKRPEGAVLELKKPSGNFTPANTRWTALRKWLIENEHITIIKHNGLSLSANQWAKRLGMSRQALWYRLNRCRGLGADLAEAVATPVGVKMPCVLARQKNRHRKQSRR